MSYSSKSAEVIDISWTPSEQCPTNEHYIIRTLNSFKIRTPEGKIIDLCQKE